MVLRRWRGLFGKDDWQGFRVLFCRVVGRGVWMVGWGVGIVLRGYS